MLAKKYRLPIGKFNESSGRQAETRRAGQLTLKRRPSPFPFSRFGVVIGKNVHPQAAKRNRLRRDIFRFFYERELYKRSGSDNLIIVSPPYPGLTREALLVALRALFA